MTESAWWYVLAGFLIGFILSTLWEWLFFRARRLRIENRRIAELEASLAAGAPAASAPAPALPPPAAGGYQGPGVFLEGEQLPPGGAILIAGGSIASAQPSAQAEQPAPPPAPQPAQPPAAQPVMERYTFVHAMPQPAPVSAGSKPGPVAPQAIASTQQGIATPGAATLGAATLGAAAGIAASQRSAQPDADTAVDETFAAPPPPAVAAAALVAAAHAGRRADVEPPVDEHPQPASQVQAQADAPPDELVRGESVRNELVRGESVSHEPVIDELARGGYAGDEYAGGEYAGEDESVLVYGEPPAADPVIPSAYRTVFVPQHEAERSSAVQAGPPPQPGATVRTTPAPAPMPAASQPQPPSSPAAPTQAAPTQAAPTQAAPAQVVGPENNNGFADRPRPGTSGAAASLGAPQRDVTQAEVSGTEVSEEDAARRAVALAAGATAGGALLFTDRWEDEAQADAPAEPAPAGAATAEPAPAEPAPAEAAQAKAATAGDLALQPLQNPGLAVVPGEATAPAPAAPLPLHAFLPLAATSSSPRNNGANASPAGVRGVEAQGIQPGLQRVSGELDSLVNSLQGLIATTDPLLNSAPDAAAAHSSEPARSAAPQGLADLPVTGPYAAENLSRTEFTVVRLMQSARQAGRDLRSIFRGR